jgi:Spy/CpxP family protein refolding chaperone
MANTGYIRQFIQDRIDDLMKPSVVCFYEHALHGDKELSRTLQAAGHDTSELDAAMKEMLESSVKVRAERVKALERFKEQGILFAVVPLEQQASADSAAAGVAR